VQHIAHGGGEQALRVTWVTHLGLLL